MPTAVSILRKAEEEAAQLDCAASASLCDVCLTGSVQEVMLSLETLGVEEDSTRTSYALQLFLVNSSSVAPISLVAYTILYAESRIIFKVLKHSNHFYQI